MSRSPPGVKRIVAILNFFADHPGQAFTLTDLVRALRLSRATCHGLLVGLVEAGYLYRTNDKSYVLGPALASIGEVAKEHFSPLQIAQSEIRALADEFDLTCTAAFREDTDVVVREKAAAASHVGFSVARGTRLPLLPQFAGMFFVSSTPAEIRAWLRRFDPAPSEEQRQAMMKGVEFVRRHHFMVAVWDRKRDAVDPGTRWIQRLELTNAPMHTLLEEIEDTKDYYPAFIQAPVYDALRRTAFVIGMHGFDERYKGAQVKRIAQRIRAACDRVGGFMSQLPAPRGG